MFCRNCGTKLEEGAAFCHNCGTPIETAVPEFEEKKVERKAKEKVVIPDTPKTDRQKTAGPASRGNGKKRKNNRQLAMIIAAVVLVLVVFFAFVIPKTKKSDTKKKDSKKESVVTDDTKESSIDWKQAYRDFFEQDEQKILRCKLIEVEALEYPMLVYEADEGSLKYELLYVTRDGKVESVICYSNTTEVYYSQEGSVFANMENGLTDRSFYHWKYDNDKDSFIEVKKGIAVLDADYYNETYSLRYDCTIDDEECEESEFEEYISEVISEVDYNYIVLDQEAEQSIDDLLKSDEKDSDKKDEVSEADDVELDTDWNHLASYIEEVVLPAYKTYISENYGNGDLDVYSLICIDSYDNIPELLFDNSGDGRGTVLLSYDSGTGIVHESEASCRGYDFMYAPKQNYVVICYAGNGLEEYTVAHMENFELVVDQTFSEQWVGDESKLKIDGETCTRDEYDKTSQEAKQKKILANGWEEHDSLENAYYSLGYIQYSFFCNEITKFEINGNQLTIQIWNGPEMTYPIQNDLDWEMTGYGENGLEVYDYWEREELKKYIEEIRAEYEKYGVCDSPGTLKIVVDDGQIVSLFTIFS